jgi:hypothetical protein
VLDARLSPAFSLSAVLLELAEWQFERELELAVRELAAVIIDIY